MEKPEILFVDDEDSLLQGLRRGLRGQRNLWNMRFANGGEAGLEQLRGTVADIIVSDMRMPGMDGAAFLREASKIAPHSIRIILSGYSEKEALMRSIGPAHLYLSKPCETEKLKQVIENMLALASRIHAKPILDLVNGMETLPVINRVYEEVLAETQSELSSAASVAKLIEKDVSLAAQTLRLANSAYFNLPKRVTSCEQAVDYLGVETIQGLLMLGGFQSQGAPSPEVAQHLERLSGYSASICLAARTIARQLKLDDQTVSAAGTAGLLCHLGTLALIVNAPRQFNEACASTDQAGNPISISERAQFGVDHGELGGYLSSLWGFSADIIKAITYHHSPSEIDSHEASVAGVVHLAQHLVKVAAQQKDAGLPEIMAGLDKGYLQQIQLPEEELKPLFDRVARLSANA